MAEISKASNEVVFCVALRHLGAEREIVVLKAKGNNFYAFPPYAKEPFGPFDAHMSWHASGERHFTVLINDQQGEAEKSVQEQSRVQLCPPETLKGVIPLYHCPVFLSHFLESLPLGTNRGKIVLLDATAARFRDEFIVVRVYAVAPGAEDEIPTFPDTGPRILYTIKETTPWLMVDVYQQTELTRT